MQVAECSQTADPCQPQILVLGVGESDFFLALGFLHLFEELVAHAEAFFEAEMLECLD